METDTCQQGCDAHARYTCTHVLDRLPALENHYTSIHPICPLSAMVTERILWILCPFLLCFFLQVKYASTVVMECFTVYVWVLSQ